MSVEEFLERAGWGAAKACPLAGDASARRYLRLYRDGDSAVLMQAPTLTRADRTSLAAFRCIGAHLRDRGLSAPKEYAANEVQGLILMEDLGDMTLSRMLTTDPTTAHKAYGVTAGLLPRLAVDPPGGLADPGADGLSRMAGLTFDLLPESETLRDTLLSALADALATHARGAPVLSLRDVHADNLIWLPDRSGDAMIGLLDFQDALLLPEGYDLASLLDDPRRDVPADWRRYLVEETGIAPRRLDTLSLARNLRILGIFHRLATQLGKPAYAAFLPRTRALISRAAADLPLLRGPVAELLARTEDWGAP